MSREYRITVSGQVQGVFFRAKTKDHADRLGIKGAVRNLPNGNVEIRVAGTREEVDQLVAAMQAEPPPIQINSLRITETSSGQTYNAFYITH